MNFQELVNYRYNFIKTEYLNTNTIKFSQKYNVCTRTIINSLWKKRNLRNEINPEQIQNEIKHDYYYEEWVQVINWIWITCFKNFITK